MGFKEAIMLDPKGYVAECTGENIFLVRRGKLYTPPAAAILEGITRDSLMALARDTLEEKRRVVQGLIDEGHAFRGMQHHVRNSALDELEVQDFAFGVDLGDEAVVVAIEQPAVDVADEVDVLLGIVEARLGTREIADRHDGGGRFHIALRTGFVRILRRSHAGGEDEEKDRR